MTATMGFTELSSTDSQASRLFLEKAFRWIFQEIQTTNGNYLTYRNPEGNMLCIRAGRHSEAPASINYVRVQDLKQAEDSVRAADGEIILPRTELPGMGSFFWFQIPSGPMMACWQDAPERQRLSKETRK
jgi:predicted enzyme related to lactoylglutathione lyase